MTTRGPQDAASVFAVTPSLEPVRFVLPRAMKDVQEDRGREVVITFLEISLAHLQSHVRREIHVKAGGEDTECPLGHC